MVTATATEPAAPPLWMNEPASRPDPARIRARIGGLRRSLCTGTVEKALGRKPGVGKVAPRRAGASRGRSARPPVPQDTVRDRTRADRPRRMVDRRWAVREFGGLGMTALFRIWRMPVLAGAALASVIVSAASATAADGVHYLPETVDVAAHWAARSTLANAVMFSGLGEALSLSMTTRDAILEHAGYVTRPAMPDMAMVGAIYAAGDPAFRQAPDLSDLRTLRWDPSSFDRTLDPAAQAWTLIKITSPEFHLNFHDDKADKRVALMMVPQAQAQARVLEKMLVNDRRLFAARRPDGTFAAPRAGDQAVVLWGVSNLILATTSTRDDYWHKAWRDLIAADDYREFADRALRAVERLPPESPADRALAIEALGRYALSTENTERRKAALTMARSHADALRQLTQTSLNDAALAVYGLTEAGRLLGEDQYAKAAAKLFETSLLPKWDDRLGAFASGGATVYTPATTAAVVAALNAMRWHGPVELARTATALYPKFVETVLVRAGLQLASPLSLVPAQYRKDRPDAAFAHPALASLDEAGVAPVFAGGVVYENGAWRVSDRRFRTAEAMFLANMLVMPRDGQADAFLPADRLSSLRR